MLTCKIGSNIINCFDGKYDRYRLKIWSNKSLLKCPICNKDYEYCHGEIATPYFRHVKNDCLDHYNEPETDEHREGKMLLYNWINNQEGIENCILEHWIPETKQRPDIYFEYNGSRFVIEFQCTPIASEFQNRRELYKLAGIKDIWILGIDKYDIIQGDDQYIHNKTKEKHIEKELNNENLLYYLDVINKKIIMNESTNERYSSIKYDHLIQKMSIEAFYKNNIENYRYYSYHNNFIKGYTNFDLDDFSFGNDTISLKENVLSDYNELESIIYKDYKNHFIKANYINEKKKIKDIVVSINKKFIEDNSHLFLTYIEPSNKNVSYIARIEIGGESWNFVYFIHEDRVDMCFDTKRKYKKFISETQTKINSEDWNMATEGNIIQEFILDTINEKLTRKNIIKEKLESQLAQKSQRNIKTFGDFLDKEIILIHQGRTSIPPNTKFKFLNSFSILDNYMESKFVDELKFLKSKKVDKYIFMIPKYHSYFNSMGFFGYVKVGNFNSSIKEVFASYGFKNVKFIDE